MTNIITIDPFNRLEGDLKVEIDVQDNIITEARSSGILFRGFERMMAGRDPMDAIVFTPRICGICSASHGVAAAKTLTSALNVETPDNAFFMRNLILGAEVAMSHLSHFYMLFAPDLTNQYFNKFSFFDDVVARFTPISGKSVERAIKARHCFLEIMGLVAGKWPNTLAIHPSGTTSTLNLSSLTRALGILSELDNFLTRQFLGCTIDEWLDIDKYDKLEEWLENTDHKSCDLGVFINAAVEAGFDRLGRGPDRYLSYGAYDLPGGGTWMPSGYYDERLHPFDQEFIREHITHSYFRDAVESRHPSDGVTVPYADKQGAYSWAKAPRYNDNSVEVGPLARMIISRDPLITNLVDKIGSNVLTRMLARLQEMIKLSRQMTLWIEGIDPNQPFYGKPSSIYKSEGIGLTEAARGSLGHWMTTSANQIENYQIITPSAWNMSPKDADGRPGPVEESLLGTEISDKENPVEVNIIIRSFDPCMSCTVH